MRDFGSYYRDPFYLQNIQVLKGPASILFGRGSTGGIVEQDSKLPTLSPFANGTLMFGTDLTKRLTADVNQPLPDLGEGSALRLNVMANQNGIADRDVVQYNRFGIAPTLVMGLGTPTRFTFTYLHLPNTTTRITAFRGSTPPPGLAERHRPSSALVVDPKQLLRL